MAIKFAPRRWLSAAVAAALVLSSFGPRAAAAAQEIAAGAASARTVTVAVVLAPASVPLTPPLSAPSAASALTPLAAPAASVSASAAPAAVPAAMPAAAPSVAAAAVSAAPAETATAAVAAAVAPTRAPEAFAAAPRSGFENAQADRLGALFDASRPGQNGAAIRPPAAAGEAAPRLGRAASVSAEARALPPRTERRARSAYFPLTLSAAVGTAGLTFKGAGAFAAALLPTAGALHFAPLILGAAAVGAFTLSGLLALNALADAAVFAAAVRRGRGVTDEAFRDFVRGEVLAGRLDANAAALLKPYRPSGRFSDMTFAFAARGSIWVRPELAAYPGLFRLVLVHELRHWKSSPTRGPPRKGLLGLLSRAAEESYARAAELRGVGALKSLKVPALERALRQAQVSLRRDAPYEILVLNPGSAELEDPKLYAGLSGGAAAVVAREGADPAAALGEAAGKGYRAVVLGGPAAILPAPRSKDAEKLEGALTQLDSLYLLATRLVARPQTFKAGSSEARAYSELAVKARRLRRLGAPPQAMSSFETEVRRFWRQLAATRLKGVAAADIADRLYGGLRDHGTAFLSFGPEDHGEQTWERLLRYWESEDGGRFGVTRVDLEDGGHILILRKLEARVGLWLRPVNGGRIAASVPRASDSEDGRAAARRALLDAGFADQVQIFDENGVSVRHVFGADVGRQEIYVTVPRRRAAAIRRFVQARAEATIGRSQANFRTHLVESGDIQNVPPVWKAGITGKGGKILWIDTGADATHEDFAGRLDVIDMVDEGPEDWIGHGTHVAGISISGGAPFLGMAKGATGTMAKVFSRDGNGASDGEIMGSAAIAQQKGYDVISLSLGSRGSSSDNLSEFLSRLTRQKNAAGEYPIVSASAGNAGPFDRSLSQPAAGVDVLAVAAAAKSLDDGRPEISFYSSVGPDVDRRFAIKRFRLKPEITGVGGDVVTLPGSANVYKFGVYSAKSKDAPRSASDLPDGRHTGMSGTSMSNPAVAGIALLVKLAMKAVGAFTPFVADNLPFAVKAVLMRSARDLEAPLWFQGAGLVDAGAAVALVARAAAKNLSRRVRALAGAVSADPDAGWGWLERLKAVVDAEDRVFAQVPVSAAPASAPTEGPAEDETGPEDEPAEDVAPDDRAAAEAARAAAAKRFMAARDQEIPALTAALKDPVWLVRQRAAFALLNLRASASALALADAALNDTDARVRQTALLALAEIPTHAADALLRAASSDPRWDVGAYAAYALARRGDRGGVSRIVAEFGNADKRARFASAWLAGQLGAQATAAEAEALSARLKDASERGNIRHLAAASLSNIADAAPGALSDRVVADLLDAAGSGNIALTRTLSRVFPAALREREFVARLRREPLKTVVTQFILANKSALQKPGALAELVQTLARAAAVPLDAPTALPDPSGAGVAGVDPALGPLDVLVMPPSGRGPAAYADASDPAALSAAFAAAGLDADFLSRFESAPRAALPVSGGLWLSVPEHKLYALSLALQGRGLKSHLVRPEAPLVAADAPAATGTVLDLARDGAPSLPADADLSLVRVRASAPVSEARALAALEQVAARVRGRGPSVLALALSAPLGRRTALSTLVDRLVRSGVGVVVAAGDGGPAAGTAAAPADAGLAAVVAAAGPDAALQFYSSRGTPESPRLSWTDRVDALAPGQAADAAQATGTGAAAERSAATLAELARVMAGAFSARDRALPEGWFAWLVSVVKAAATPMPGYAPHEVGAGLLDAGRASAELERRLGDLDAVAREADALVAAGLAGPKDVGPFPLPARSQGPSLSAGHLP